MPLAVELAAARTSVLTPEQILERLSQRLDLLKGGRDADPRQQTLRATIEWSYELLTPKSSSSSPAFPSSPAAARWKRQRRSCDADLDTLQSLVEKSLAALHGRPLLDAGDDPRVRRVSGSQSRATKTGRWSASSSSSCSLAVQLEATFLSGGAYAPFASEQDNFRASLMWAESEGDAAQHDLIGRSWPFWWYRGHPRGLRWVESALGRIEGEKTIRRAKVLTAGAMFAYRARRSRDARAHTRNRALRSHGSCRIPRSWSGH